MSVPHRLVRWHVQRHRTRCGPWPDMLLSPLAGCSHRHVCGLGCMRLFDTQCVCVSHIKTCDKWLYAMRQV